MEYGLKPEERASLVLRGLYEKYGYRKYKMGKFEEYSLYARNSNFLVSDKVLTFNDLDGRLLAMKPDVTLSVINNTSATETETEKLYYIENVYRENRESHCFKEINQMGLEYLGCVDDYAVAEVMSLAAGSMEAISKAMGGRDSEYLLVVSHMGYVLDLLEDADISEEDRINILSAIRKKNREAVASAAKAAGLGREMTDVLSVIPSLYGSVDEICGKASSMALNDKMRSDVEELKEYCDILSGEGYGKSIRIDLSMVNDIDYYNGIIFHGYIESLPGCVLAGGQYDKAMALLGKKGRAVGFAIYLDEIEKGKTVPDSFDTDILFVYGDGASPADVIREVRRLQEKAGSVMAQPEGGGSVRCREMYRLKDGKAVKEDGYDA